MKLSQIAGVSAAGARRRNPSVEGTPIRLVIATELSSASPIVILSEAKDLCNESW